MGHMFKQLFSTVTTFISALELFAFAFRAFGDWAKEAAETFTDEAKDERELAAIQRKERIRQQRAKITAEIQGTVLEGDLT